MESVLAMLYGTVVKGEATVPSISPSPRTGNLWMKSRSDSRCLPFTCCHIRPRHHATVSVQGERRLSVCWSKYEREQWERERAEREREAERLRRISSTEPKADEPEPELETEEREAELVRS